MVDSISQVLSEIINGDALGMGAAARLVPSYRGGSDHARPSTIWRWIVTGLTTPTGAVIRLESARVGNRWLTSRKAMERFFIALTESATPPTDPTPTPPIPTQRSVSARRKRSEAAARKLESMGA
jgi:hypothetical protein